MAAIWVLTGSKTGDNAQVLRAANAMGLPFETRHMVLKPEFETAKPKVEPSLHIFDLAASESRFNMLMGKGEAAARRAWLEEHGNEAEADI